MRDNEEPACCIAVIGRGRLGTVLAAALSEAGHPVIGPLGRDAVTDGDAGAGGATAGRALAEAHCVLLCVPDAEIEHAARALAEQPPAGARRLVGHCSGATGLHVLASHHAFSLHPLMTVTERDAARAVEDAGSARELLAGAGAAVAGATPDALAAARALAIGAGLRPVEIADADRAAYHAAASIASNFLITLEAAAEQLAASAGADRDLLVPLVRATVENWAAAGPARALTGPIARGDEATVARQRDAVAERAPELLELFDALCGATRALADKREAVVA